jgi:hypothetical protein
VVSEDKGLEDAVYVAARTNSLVNPLGGPATPAEIAAAPDWIRKLEGYES